MRVHGRHHRAVWLEGTVVRMIDQNRLPFAFHVAECADHRATASAIRDMTVRGAPSIGAAAALALGQAFAEAPRADPWGYAAAARRLVESARPTARDLFEGTARVWDAAGSRPDAPAEAARQAALAFADAVAEDCRRIGTHGAGLLPSGARVLTHCNAGWLATVDHGSALAPVYAAAAAGRRPFVWVGETRPRGQGARLTAWELGHEEVACAVIADAAAAHLMSRGEVDLVIVGADRIAASGDVVNKIGTLSRALCARAHDIPFYVAAPASTLDAGAATGSDVEIEERSEDEVHYQTGPDEDGVLRRIRVTAPGSAARNPAFDVTPAALVTAYITERGVLPLEALHGAPAARATGQPA
jgi:methylthioribose-1-phosphate isomerase